MSDRAEHAESYRNKAEEVRTIAETMREPNAKEMLIGLADDYLRLAEVLERTTIPDPIPATELEFRL